jgi:hypothetical protein
MVNAGWNISNASSVLVAVRKHLRLVFDTAALRESAVGAAYL